MEREEAIKIVKSHYPANKQMLNEALEFLIPELKESENERIRKALVRFHKSTIDVDGIKGEEILAWLEKQKAMDKDIIFRPLAGTDIIVAAKQALEKIEIGKEVVLAFNGAYIPVNGKTVAEICNEYFSWVEKQGEQKAIGMKSSEESLGVSSKEYNEIVNECLYGESKPTDKVEPKFKVGDWVVTSYGKVNQVIAVDKDGDGFTLDDGTYFSGSWKDDYHLWTIQDAKDGDVLVDDLGNICIYKESPFSLNSMYYSYCYGNHKYFVDGGGSHVIVDTCPASKEQRNILFKKMKEEGYEWDAEKKELKKIDTVQPKFNVGDWILYSGDHYEGVRHITKIDENGYYIERNGLPHGIIPFEHEICMTLWTIQDAKDGDVLATENFIFIFKNIDDGNGVHYYCQYEISKHEDDNQFDIALPQSLMGRVGNSIIHYSPATKEQRDTLFKAMTEKGYEWDAEKKELKKINSYCQENCKGYQETGKCFADGGCDAKRKAEQKSTAWSEKDDKAIESLLHTLDSIEDEWFHDMTEEKYWLKSIKNRLTTK